MPGLKVTSGKTGKTYDMPWSLPNDPSDDEVDRFIQSQESANPTGPVKVKGLAGDMKSRMSNFEALGKGSFKDNFLKPAIKPFDTNDISLATDSYPVRAGKELFNTFVSDASSPAAVTGEVLGGKALSALKPYLGRMFPTLLKGGRAADSSVPSPMGGRNLAQDAPRTALGDTGQVSPMKPMASSSQLPTNPTSTGIIPPGNDFIPVGSEPLVPKPVFKDPVEDIYKKVLDNGGKPLSKTDVLNAEIVKGAGVQKVKAVSKVRPMPDGTIRLLNPNETTVNEMISKGYQPASGEIAEDGSISLIKKVGDVSQAPKIPINKHLESNTPPKIPIDPNAVPGERGELQSFKLPADMLNPSLTDTANGDFIHNYPLRNDPIIDPKIKRMKEIASLSKLDDEGKLLEEYRQLGQEVFKDKSTSLKDRQGFFFSSAAPKSGRFSRQLDSDLNPVVPIKKVGDVSAPLDIKSPSFPEGGNNGGIPPLPTTAVNPVAPSPKKPKLGDGFITTLGSNLKSATAGLDFSAPLRQGRALMHKKEFYKAIPDMFKSWASEDGYKALNTQIKAHPHYEKFKDVINFSDMGDDITKREEQFAGAFVDKLRIPFTNIHPYRASGRAYSGFLNKLRMDTAASLYDDASKIVGKDVGEEFTGELGRLVNTLTGRGDLPTRMEGAAPTLNALFFSPRFVASRVKLLTSPVSYANADPFVRKEALKSLAALVSSQATLVGLLNAAKGDVKLSDIGKSKFFEKALGGKITDSDFMKIKAGKNRVDTNAGVQQLFVLASRLAKQETTSPVSKRTTKLDTGKYGAPSSMSTLGRFTVSKGSPLAGLVKELWTGKDYFDQNISAGESIIRHTTPMVAQDLYDIAQEDPKYAWLVLPAAFGASVNTYRKKK